MGGNLWPPGPLYYYPGGNTVLWAIHRPLGFHRTIIAAILHRFSSPLLFLMQLFKAASSLWSPSARVHVGVAVSASPWGPYTDPLGAPLVQEPSSLTGAIDPHYFRC